MRPSTLAVTTGEWAVDVFDDDVHQVVAGLQHVSAGGEGRVAVTAADT